MHVLSQPELRSFSNYPFRIVVWDSFLLTTRRFTFPIPMPAIDFDDVKHTPPPLSEDKNCKISKLTCRNSSIFLTLKFIYLFIFCRIINMYALFIRCIQAKKNENRSFIHIHNFFLIIFFQRNTRTTNQRTNQPTRTRNPPPPCSFHLPVLCKHVFF